MNFKVIDNAGSREYTGFQSAHTRRPFKSSDILVIAWFDGEPELWYAENEAGIEALRRYYRDEWGDREIPFDTHARLKSDPQ